MREEESRPGVPAPSNAPKSHGMFWFLLGLCVAGAVAFGVHRYGTSSAGDGAAVPEASGASGAQAGAGQRSGQTPEKGSYQGKRGGSGSWDKSGGGMQGPRSVPVVVSTVKRGDLPVHLDAPGTVIALNTVTVRTRVDGQVVKVNYEEGQLVHAGDSLVEIDPRSFEVAVAQAEANLAKAKADAEQARAALGKDQAQSVNANLELERDTTLLAKKMVSKEDYDSHKYQAAALEATLKADEANIKAAEESVHSVQTAIDSAKLQLSYCHILAPVSGRIGLRLVDQGNMVRAADSTGLAVITQVDPITVTFSLAEDDLPQVLKANAGESKLPVEVWNRDRSTRLASGTLKAADSQIDLSTLTLKFKAIFDNADLALFPNQAVNVRLLVDTKKDVLLIPPAAVQRAPSERGQPQSTFVYVVKAEGTVEMRTIKVGLVEGDNASVEEGLADGEVVVVQGVDKLENGMKVTTPGSDAVKASPAPESQAAPSAGTAEPAAAPAQGTPGPEGAPHSGGAGKRRNH